MAVKKQAKPAARKVGRKAVAVKRAKQAVPKAAKQAAKKTASRKAARRAIVARQKPQSLRLLTAGPSFTVNDIHKSLEFYCEVLGFTVKERWEEDGTLHGAELVAGTVRFWLGQDDWKKGRDRAKGLGFRIYCRTSQDVDALAARIKARGGALAQEPTDQAWGGRDFAVVDPDGFAITISSGL